MSPKKDSKKDKVFIAPEINLKYVFIIVFFAFISIIVIFREDFGNLRTKSPLISTLPEMNVEETCHEVMTYCNLQIPKHTAPPEAWNNKYWGICFRKIDIKNMWINNNCSSILKLFDEVVYSFNSVLPPEIYKPVLQTKEYLELQRITDALIIHCNERDIDYVAVFGSLMAIVRNQVLNMPWDDDMDLAVPAYIGKEDILQILSKGASAVSFRGHHCSFFHLYISKSCKKWEIAPDVFLSYKNTGVPLRISGKTRYPFIDIYTYNIGIDTINKNKKWVYIEKQELANGHIHNFTHAYDDFFPLKKVKVEFSGEESKKYTEKIGDTEIIKSINLKKKIEMNLPSNAKKILKEGYGDEVLNLCKTEYNHRPFRNSQPLVNRVIKATFPCEILPENYYHHEKKSLEILSTIPSN